MNARKIFITGGTSGVGLIVAKKLLQKGHEVTVTGRNPAVLAELESLGARTIQADLSNVVDLESAISFAGLPEIVIFSAGIGTFAYADELTDEQMEAMFHVNVMAPMQMTKRLLPGMKGRGSGHFIFLASQAGKVATPKASAYAATKHAIIGYTNALRMEIEATGIHVTAINPGPIDTPFLDIADTTGSYRNSMRKFLLPAEKVADAVIHSINYPKREVNLPSYMSLSSKLYALAPTFSERLGKRFFTKK
ncbi:SDR family NAD(P)-dependent oxidoreductase [Chungangia koreensis]|uniref:SDR family NAD(P)-dependent oxidoreductase n=1 Tax=Chungangia koreensis TaxID=752657 RepID=A0ABV8X717_9LACT